MTVHQVEEYYVHIDTTEASKEAIDKAEEFLGDECFDYDLGSDYIVIEDFSDESEANTVNEELINILNRQ